MNEFQGGQARDICDCPTMYRCEGQVLHRRVSSEFFVELGSPGGAAKVGPTSTDHADVIAAAAKSE